jgi:hypothetical protein
MWMLSRGMGLGRLVRGAGTAGRLVCGVNQGSLGGVWKRHGGGCDRPVAELESMCWYARIWISEKSKEDNNRGSPGVRSISLSPFTTAIILTVHGSRGFFDGELANMDPTDSYHRRQLEINDSLH